MFVFLVIFLCFDEEKNKDAINVKTVVTVEMKENEFILLLFLLAPLLNFS